MAKSNSRKRQSGGGANRVPGTRPPLPATSQAVVVATASPRDDADLRIFLSYARADDDVYKMIRPFKKLLAHFVHAKSGRRVVAFLDQDDIEWGQVWKDRLNQEVLGAAIFIPLLSSNYLASNNCRLEFNQFVSAASNLGASELLLPVLLINAPAIFNERSTDEVVIASRQRQWEVIEDAVLSDSDSSEWKRTMARLADRLVAASSAAEQALLGSRRETDGPAQAGGEDDGKGEDDDEPGLAEMVDIISEHSQEMRAALESLTRAMGSFTAVTNDTSLSAPAEKESVQAWTAKLATRLSGPAGEIEIAGNKMFAATRLLDGDFRRLRQIAEETRDYGSIDGYNSVVGEFKDVTPQGEMLAQFLEKMRPAESMSAALRKALRPARVGFTKVADSIALMATWQPLA